LILKLNIPVILGETLREPNHLFPPVFKIIGLVLLLPGLAFAYLFIFQDYAFPFLNYGPPSPKHNEFNRTGHNNLTDEITITLIITGLIFIGFSKLKNESALTNKLRLRALYSAVLVNFVFSIVLIVTNSW